MHRAAVLFALLAAPSALLAGSAPAWVQNGADPQAYPPARYLTGYGLSSPGGSQAEQRQQAMAMAQEALAASIRTHILSDFTSRVTQQDQQGSHFARSQVRIQADVELDGLDTVLVWVDAKRKLTCALAVLDKPRALGLLEEKLGRQARECLSGFDLARSSDNVSGLLQARQLRGRIEEGLLIGAVLAGTMADPACPCLSDIDRELGRVLAGRKDLGAFVAIAALELGSHLPRGLRLLMDRVTFADTPFRGSFSGYLEQALGSALIASGQVRVLDKGAGRDAVRTGEMASGLPETLGSQAVLRGVCFDLGKEVQVDLRVTALGGEELAATTLKIPAALLRGAGLKLVPDNYEEARKALEICSNQVLDSKLKVRLALDRGDGGLYRPGDKLYLFLKANLDCCVKVIYHQVDGRNVQLFPNEYQSDPRIQKDRLYQIPPENAPFNLEVLEPFGVEIVQVLACTDPLERAGQDGALKGLPVVSEDLGGLLGRTRGIALRKAESQYAEATAVVNTVAGPERLLVGLVPP